MPCVSSGAFYSLFVFVLTEQTLIQTNAADLMVPAFILHWTRLGTLSGSSDVLPVGMTGFSGNRTDHLSTAETRAWAAPSLETGLRPYRPS